MQWSHFGPLRGHCQTTLAAVALVDNTQYFSQIWQQRYLFNIIYAKIVRIFNTLEVKEVSCRPIFYDCCQVNDDWNLKGGHCCDIDLLWGTTLLSVSLHVCTCMPHVLSSYMLVNKYTSQSSAIVFLNNRTLPHNRHNSPDYQDHITHCKLDSVVTCKCMQV